MLATLIVILFYATCTGYLVSARLKSKLIAGVHESVLSSLRLTEQKVLNEISRRLEMAANLAAQVEQAGDDEAGIRHLLNGVLVRLYNTASAPMAAYVAFPDGRLICSGPVWIEKDLRQRAWWRQYLRGRPLDEPLGQAFTTRGLLLNAGFVGQIRNAFSPAVIPVYWVAADSKGSLKFVLGMDFGADLTETPTESLFAFEKGSFDELFDANGILLAFPSTGLASVQKYRLFSDSSKTNPLVRAALTEPDVKTGYRTYINADGVEVLGMYLRGALGFIYTREKPVADVYGAVNREIISYIWLIFTLAAVTVLLLTGFLFRGIVRPVHQLTSAMDRLGAGDLEARIRSPRRDEFGQLFRQFNATAERLQLLIKEAYVERLARRQAELEFLQAQINPHFLYNTLDCIYKLVESGDSEEGCRAIVNLSRLFRLSLGRGRRLVKIAEALEQLRRYLDLQHLRYGDRITVSIQVSDDLLACEIPKLLLQPLVENAFVHGLEPKQGRGLLSISGTREGDAVHFTIADDGIGMTDEELARVEEALRDSAIQGSHGLVNAHRRLVLAYGDEWGLNVSRNTGGGLRVDIRWPARCAATE